ncbi:MAG TPA: hypothetical protein VFD60_07625 [Nitrososphaeraceae archaeon]|nr:hypothetical protein [Nitrososphaeraceae archaeon]
MANCLQTRLSLPSGSNIVEKATTGAIYIFPIPGAFDRGFEVKFFTGGITLAGQSTKGRMHTIREYSSRIMTMIPI